MSKSKTKQHYVQQRYLKYFSTDGEKKIHVYDKIANVIRKNQPISRIACESGFYDIDFALLIGEINDQSKMQAILDFEQNIGKTFADFFLTNQIEPLFCVVDDLIDKINENKLVESTYLNCIAADSIRDSISTYLTYQYLRTASFRDHIIDLLNDENSRTDISLRDSQINKLLQIKLMLDVTLISELIVTISSGIWVIGRANNEKVFFSSDNPIYVIVDPDKKPGIFSNVILITYPLTPKLILMIWSPKTANKNGYIDYENRIVDIKEQGIDWLNKQRVLGAKRYVVCSANQIEIACEMNIELCNLTPYEKLSKFCRL